MLKNKSKKGSSIIMMIAEILAVLLVLTLVYQAVINVSKGEGIESNNIVNELVMGIEAATTVNGNFKAEFPYQNLTNYTFLLSNDKILMTGKEVKLTYLVNLPEGYLASGVVEKAERLCLDKEGQTIYIRGC
jgi:hypothetical protein